MITDGSMADKLWKEYRIAYNMGNITSGPRLSITMRTILLTEEAMQCMRQAGLWRVDDHPEGVR